METTPQADYDESREKIATWAIKTENVHPLEDLTNTQLEIAIPNIDQLDNDTYITVRRQGFGASDSSILLGVNPFKNREELIQEKISTTISDEERAIGEKTAVRKGRDLEPLIIQKFQKVFQMETFKPSHMYRFRDYPFLTVNFDGVTGTPKQYIPAEIKVVTMYGEKHYDFTKSMFDEINGFKPLPVDVSKNNWSIENKAAHYGIPAYYYTQLQQQIFALNASYGYLSVLRDKDWIMCTYWIPRDDMVIKELILQGYQTWNIIERLQSQDATKLSIKKREADIVQYMRDHHVSWAEASNAIPLVQDRYIK